MAQNGWRALDLAIALQEGRILEALVAINRHDAWPFGYSLLLVPFFVIFGPTLAAATFPQILTYAVMPAAIAFLGSRCASGAKGFWAGALAAAMFLSSPLPQLFAILVMRELAGALGVIVATTLYLRALDTGRLGSYRAVGVAVLVLFFIKYNYAVIWLAAAGLFELSRIDAAQWHQLRSFLSHWLWPWHRPTWLQGLVALGSYVLAAGLILRLSVGVAVYGFVVLITVTVLAAWRERVPSLRAWVADQPPAVRAIVETFALPVWIWSLSPSPIHPKGVLDFLRNRSSNLSWAEGLLYYPRAFVEHFVPAVYHAAFVVLGLVAVVVLWRRLSSAARFVVVLSAVMVLALLLHPYKIPRFLIIALPPLFVSASLGFSLMMHWGMGTLRRFGFPAVACAAMVTVWLWPSGLRPHEYVKDHYPFYSAAPELRLALLGAQDLATRRGALGVLGTFNQLSPTLVEWALHDRDVERSFRVVHPMRRVAPEVSEERLRELRDRWIARQRPEEILAIVSTEASPWYGDEDFQLYNAWQLAVIDAFVEDPEWRICRHRELTELAARVLVLLQGDCPPSPGTRTPARGRVPSSPGASSQ
jgi:hypothetical protein